MTALLRAQKISRAANFQIPHRNSVARSQSSMHLQRLHPFPGLTTATFPWHQKEGIGPVLRPTHSTTELVKIGQTKPVGPVQDDRVGVRDIQTAFHDRGA